MSQTPQTEQRRKVPSLLAYIASLRQASTDDGDAVECFARRLGTRRVYFTHLAHGHRLASPSLARRIEIESGGAVPAHDLRPDIFPPPSSGLTGGKP